MQWWLCPLLSLEQCLKSSAFSSPGNSPSSWLLSHSLSLSSFSGVLGRLLHLCPFISVPASALFCPLNCSPSPIQSSPLILFLHKSWWFSNILQLDVDEYLQVSSKQIWGVPQAITIFKHEERNKAHLLLTSATGFPYWGVLSLFLFVYFFSKIWTWIPLLLFLSITIIS